MASAYVKDFHIHIINVYIVVVLNTSYDTAMRKSGQISNGAYPLEFVLQRA